MKIFSRLFVAIFIAAPVLAVAQVSYTTADATYLQDFNSGLPASSNNSAAWTQNSTFEGWYANFTSSSNPVPATYRINSATANGTLQQFRANASADDGALGSRPSDASASILYGLRLVNNTGLTLAGFNLGYTGEQWSNSDSGNNNNIVVAYQFGAIGGLRNGTWTNVDALTFDSIFDGDGSGGTQTASDLPGYDAANSEIITPVTVTATWLPGEELWIRWFDTNTPSIDHALAIDNVTFSATAAASAIPEPSTYALLGGVLALGCAVWRRRQV